MVIKMKRNEIKEIREKIKFINYENFFNVYESDDVPYYYNINKKVNIPTDIDTFYYNDYIVKSGDTWTYIAKKAYNDVSLWWLICSANNIQDPLQFPEVGKKLKILNNDVVRSILLKIGE